jgi:hypothetical protein
MSLDLYLYAPTKCPHCGGSLTSGEEIFWQNYTHNVTPMWAKAGVYDALYMSDGRTAKEYVDALEHGVADMVAKPAEYISLNANNGWGTYDTALPWLQKVLIAFKENPEAVIRVSK